MCIRDRNEDGHARGILAGVFKNLSYEEIELLLPQIYKAVVEPAPTGNMFADNVRLTGLEILAKHRIKEGVPLCYDLIERTRWGQGKRLEKCLKTLQQYGSAGKSLVPKLKQLEKDLGKGKPSDKKTKRIQLVRQTIKVISSGKAEKLRPLPRG